MKVKGHKVYNPIEIKTTIYQCPYCHKKLINKNSYRNHILSSCSRFQFEYEEMKQNYEQNKITKAEYYKWLNDNGYTVDLKDEDIKDIGEALYKEIKETQDYCYPNYFGEY